MAAVTPDETSAVQEMEVDVIIAMFSSEHLPNYVRNERCLLQTGLRFEGNDTHAMLFKVQQAHSKDNVRWFIDGEKVSLFTACGTSEKLYATRVENLNATKSLFKAQKN